MSFDVSWASAMATLHAQFGIPAIWYAATDTWQDEGKPCQAVLGQGTYGFNSAGWATEVRPKITLLTAEVPSQSHGDTIKMSNGTMYTLDALIQPDPDPSSSTWWVLETPAEE